MTENPIITLYREGIKQRFIARRLGIKLHTVKRAVLIYRRENPEALSFRCKSGPGMTEAQSAHLVELCTRRPPLQYIAIARRMERPKTTVRRWIDRLIADGLLELRKDGTMSETKAVRTCGGCRHMIYNECYRYPPQIVLWPGDNQHPVLYTPYSTRPDVSLETPACGEWQAL